MKDSRQGKKAVRSSKPGPQPKKKVPEERSDKFTWDEGDIVWVTPLDDEEEGNKAE